MAIPDVDPSGDRFSRSFARDPRNLANVGLARFEFRALANHNAAATRLDARNVERLARLHAKPLPLANGEAMHTVVLGDYVARSIDDFAALRARLRPYPLDDLCVIALRNESDLLTLGLVGRDQTQFASLLPYLRLRPLAQRKPGLRELLLVELKQEVGLVL